MSSSTLNPAAAVVQNILPTKPSDHLMVVYKESYVGASDWYATSGGKPLFDWTGIDSSAPTPFPNPKQNCPANNYAK